ncbi:hypothetical protein AU512_15370 [Lonsdalea iberica]|uniref:Uncharacterized protein n=1 Tax=Lonsdalea iberica TaxID=1082703 RepID=A0ABX3XCA7_9GAMM|nr:hypothetical protein [Lonsdalea iberica]OSN05970.1 hypothetical protein AU512_15370 [Lonsdalea iberica]
MMRTRRNSARRAVTQGARAEAASRFDRLSVCLRDANHEKRGRIAITSDEIACDAVSLGARNTTAGQANVLPRSRRDGHTTQPTHKESGS